MALTLRGNGQVSSDNYGIDSDGSITATGNVGIGTAPTNRTLTVSDTTSRGIVSIISANTQPAIVLFGDSDADSVGQIRYDNGDNSLAFRVNSTERMRIDSTGIVTTPNQPAFTAYQLDTGTQDEYPITSQSGTLIANSAAINRGSIYNNTNGKFTAPVAGVYHLTFNLSLYCTGLDVDNSVGWGLYVNGSRYLWTTYTSALAVTQSTPWVIGDGNTADQDNSLTSATEIGAPHYSANISLSQNDYVQVGWMNLSQALGVRSFIFSGHLIG